MRGRVPSEITEAQVFHLIRGYDYFEEFPFESEGQRRELWFKHRAELLAREGTTPDELGTYGDPLYPAGGKPAAWYDYELEATHA